MYKFSTITYENFFDNIEENQELREEEDSIEKLRIEESTGFQILSSNSINKESDTFQENKLFGKNATINFNKSSEKIKNGAGTQPENQCLSFENPFNSDVINFENENFSLTFIDFINRSFINHKEGFQFDSLNLFPLNLDSSYSLKDSNENNLIGKKRILFKIIYPEKFSIFNKGGENKIIRGLIDENLHNKISPKNIKSSKKIRKFNADNIRKKIKSRFLKALKTAINQKLKKANSIKFFNLLPQKFICNVSKKINRNVLYNTFKEIYSKDFCENQKEINADYSKYCQNIEVLEYLEKKNDIAIKSNYDTFKNMKYYQIFEEYLRSKEFENEITNLNQEKENVEYINDYIKLACNFIDFFFE